jgi:hypothetical protein
MEKYRQMIRAFVSPYLQPGEQVELATSVTVGTVPVAEKAAMIVATSIMSGGTIAMYTRPLKQYMVLTDRRVLFIRGNRFNGRPDKLNSELPRAGLSASEPRGRFTRVVMLSVAGNPKGLKLRFPVPARHDGEQFAAALGAGTGTPSAA